VVRPGALPESFLFGVASSDHQSEAYDPRYPDIWDRWEAETDAAPRGRAVDFWNRYPEDIELARSLGCRSYRFSLSWARLEPTPGEFSAEAFAHYRDVIDRIRAAGMEPVITLVHWVWPLHVEDRGGLIADEFPEWFERYATEVARRLGEGVRYWVTFNEPNALPFGYVKAWGQKQYSMPPGRDQSAAAQLRDAAKLVRNLFVAHTRARQAMRALCPQAQLGANPCVLGFPTQVQQWLDRQISQGGSLANWAQPEEEAARTPRRAVPWARPQFGGLAFFANTNWWHLGMAGRLPEHLCPAECVGQHDYMGLDYYWGISTLKLPRIFRLLEAMDRQFGRAPVWPRGLYHALRHMANLFPGMDVMILENGCPAQVEGITRPDYLRQHLREVVRARGHGANVTAYHCWCLTTTCEWGLECDHHSDFGLFRVDLAGDPALIRFPTLASHAYREIIARRGP
jgi:beta-glucosidase/6-phospho-beta-glucosidase/beta-galactosidase